EIVVDHGSMVVADGCRGLGQSVAHQAMSVAIERVREHGLVLLGLRNAHHIGRVGHWAEMAIGAGLVSVHFVSAFTPPRVAPHAGRDARFATNPFTVGIPRRGRPPLLLDWATSAIAQGKVRIAYNSGRPVPAGALLDAEGRPRVDPAVMFEPPLGALLPMAGHKGFGLAIVNELLSAALLGGEPLHDLRPLPRHAIWNNMLAIVLDPARLGDLDAFEREAAAYEDWVRSSRIAEGFDAIRMPGEPEREARSARAAGIAIDARTMAQLDWAADAVDRALPLLSGLAQRARPAPGAAEGRGSGT
ncbi:MAG: malate/lactate/ureidoglycolate dehydrogenase, partial [Burkholderiales bacterium]